MTWYCSPIRICCNQIGKENVPIVKKDIWMPTLLSIDKGDGITKRNIEAFQIGDGMEASIVCLHHEVSLRRSIFPCAKHNDGDFRGSGMIVTTLVQMRS